MNILDLLAAHAKERCEAAKEYISLEELKKLAAEIIDSGKAQKTLEKVIEVSNRPEDNA